MNKKVCLIKWGYKFNNYKDYLSNNKILLESQKRFKDEAHWQNYNISIWKQMLLKCVKVRC